MTEVEYCSGGCGQEAKGDQEWVAVKLVVKGVELPAPQWFCPVCAKEWGFDSMGVSGDRTEFVVDSVDVSERKIMLKEVKKIRLS